MINYMKIILLFLFFADSSCTHQNKRLNKASVIEKLLDSLYEAKIFNGAIVVAEGDSIIFSKGYGYANFKDSILFTPETLSDGGSLAKTFTAAALWKLQMQGSLSLKDPVQKFLPLYPYPTTSILDLITHNTGGLPDYDYFFPFISDTSILTNNTMLTILGHEKPSLADESRQSFNYENCGIDLAALLIEKVTGKKYQQVLSEFFFHPLRIDSTRVRPPMLADIKASRAIGYQWENDSLVSNDIQDREGFYGSCNLHFTTLDLCKWGSSFYNGRLHDDIRKEGDQPGMIAGKQTGLTKLNWYYAKDKKAFYYWGNVSGFYSHLYHDDEKKFTIAFMTNTTLPFPLRQPLATALAEIMEYDNYDRTLFRLPSYLAIKNTDEIFGFYQTEKGDSIHVFRSSNGIHIQRSKGLRYNMYIQQDDITGYVPGIDAWIGFTKENSKLVLHWNSVFLKETARKNHSGPQ